jgi:uncharacterized protein (DUF58 family)
VSWQADDGGRQARRGTVVVGLLMLAFVIRQPALVALAVPLTMAWWLAARDRHPRGTFTARFQPAGMLEDDRAPLTIAATAIDGAVQATVAVTHQLDREPTTVWLTPRRPQAEIAIVPHRWGASRIGPVVVRALSPGGITWTQRVPVGHPHAVTDERGRIVIPVHPRLDSLDVLPRAADTMPTPGVHTSRRAGRGVEFADLRPGQPGDHLRDVNWRVTARRGELWVSQRHPDDRQDVVLLLDTFDGHVLPDAVRLAYALMSAYLGQRDRIGVIGFGGVLQWVAPGGGARHQYRVEAALIASQAAVSAAWRDLRIVPPRTLPPHALVIAMTPLREERTIRAMHDLLGRGRQLAVVDVADRLSGPTPEPDPLAVRLDRIQRETEHDRLRQLGATVVIWGPDESPLGVVSRAVDRRRLRA